MNVHSGLRNLMAAAGKLIPANLSPWDLVGLASVLTVAKGIDMMHRPSALIFLGLVGIAIYLLPQLSRKA